MSSIGGDLSSQLPGLPPKQTSMPISRSSGATYEKPERARTSHACEPCRERKTKCDGERPSCRRCLHTGTNCHYGYGKGWRKRKTAEDLTATSRRLARYEALLNDIMPHVPPNVKTMIEEAREQDAAASNSGGSETTETNDITRGYPPLPGELSSGSNDRVSLPLPLPMSLGGQAPLGFPRTFESPVNPALRPNSRSSTEEQPANRLPSITAQGLLIEPSLAAQTGAMPQVSSDPALYTRDRSVGNSDSPTKQYAEMPQQHSAPG